MQIGTVLITKKVLDLINSKVKFWQHKVPPSNIHTYVRNIYEYINKEPTRFTGETGVYAHSQRSVQLAIVFFAVFYSFTRYPLYGSVRCRLHIGRIVRLHYDS